MMILYPLRADRLIQDSSAVLHILQEAEDYRTSLKVKDPQVTEDVT